MNGQGHVVAAIQREAGKDESGQANLEFYQADSGQRLLTVPTDLESIGSLEFSPSTRLLYATGAKSEQLGVYRLDVFFDGAQQQSRATEVAVVDRAQSITLSDQRSVIMVSGKSDGRLIAIDIQ